MKVYLSGPIDNCSENEIADWRNFLKDRYPHITFFDPVEFGKDFHTNPAAAIEREKKYIQDCDVFLCYPWKPTTGTSMEAMHAHHHGRTIVIISHDNVYLSPWLDHHASYTTNNFKSAMKWIEQLELVDETAKL